MWRPSVMLVVTRAPAARMQPSAIRLSAPTVAIGCTSTAGVSPAAVSVASIFRRTAARPDPDHEARRRVIRQGSDPRCNRSMEPRYLVPRRARRSAVASLSSIVAEQLERRADVVHRVDDVEHLAAEAAGTHDHHAGP